MNWLLIVVLVILIGNSLVGLKAGFIKTVFSLVSMILALILTVWISPTVNDFLRSNEKFYDFVTQRVEQVISSSEEGEKLTNQEAYINDLPLPKSLKETLVKNNTADVYGAMAIQSFQDYITNYIANIIINALAFTITFLAILIALRILCSVLNIISMLPVLKQINKAAGLAAGLLHGLIIVWVLFILLTVFGGTSFGQSAFLMIEENQILSLIYDNNLLLRFVTNATKLLF